MNVHSTSCCTHTQTQTHMHTHRHFAFVYIFYYLIPVTTCSNWIWSQEELHKVLSFPHFLCPSLIPVSHCVTCGTPVMASSCYAVVNCSHSQQGGDLSPLLKATEKWLTSSPLRVGLCGCHGRETPEQHQLVGSEHSTHSLTECDILLKLQEKDLMLRFDFCSKHCGDAFINFIFNIAS